jgi:hypothetical protein
MLGSGGNAMNAIRVRVVTGSSKPRVEKGVEGSFKVYVSSPPEKGRANAEMLKMLAKHLGVPKSRLSISRGETSREKTIEIRRE